MRDICRTCVHDQILSPCALVHSWTVAWLGNTKHFLAGSACGAYACFRKKQNLEDRASKPRSLFTGSHLEPQFLADPAGPLGGRTMAVAIPFRSPIGIQSAVTEQLRRALKKKKLSNSLIIVTWKHFFSPNKPAAVYLSFAHLSTFQARTSYGDHEPKQLFDAMACAKQGYGHGHGPLQ